MNIDYRIRRHPAKQELFAYAETLLDRSGPLPGHIGAHLSTCPQCSGEVKAMRASLEFSANAKALEGSDELSAAILLEARRVRKHQDRARRRYGVIAAASRGLGYAAALVLVSVATFSLVLGNPGNGNEPVDSIMAPTSVADAAAAADYLEKAAENVRALSAAMADGPTPQTLKEWEKLRAVNATDTDLTAAFEALARNPGNERAAQVVQSSLRRQAETLRDLYIDRSL